MFLISVHSYTKYFLFFLYTQALVSWIETDSASALWFVVDGRLVGFQGDIDEVAWLRRRVVVGMTDGLDGSL